MTELIAHFRGYLFTLACNYLRKNITVGPGLKIYKKLLISGKGKVVIGANCIVKGILGDNSQYVCLDTLSPDSEIIIGDFAKLYAGRISAKFAINIGNEFHIEESGIADTDFHSIDKSRKEPVIETIEKCRIQIGDRVHVGARSFVSKGVKIGDDVIIWPGSIVTSSVNVGETVCGNPAKPVKF